MQWLHRNLIYFWKAQLIRSQHALKGREVERERGTGKGPTRHLNYIVDLEYFHQCKLWRELRGENDRVAGCRVGIKLISSRHNILKVSWSKRETDERTWTDEKFRLPANTVQYTTSAS